jgi:hypothetical protein
VTVLDRFTRPLTRAALGSLRRKGGQWQATVATTGGPIWSLRANRGKRGRTHGEALGGAIAKALRRTDFMSRQNTGEPLSYVADAVSTTFHDFPGISPENWRVSRRVRPRRRCHDLLPGDHRAQRLRGTGGVAGGPGSRPTPDGVVRRRVGARPRCSAFVATGSATVDARIVAAHTPGTGSPPSTPYSVVLDIRPSDGHRVLMQAAPGSVTSNADCRSIAGRVYLDVNIKDEQFDAPTARKAATNLRRHVV